MDIVVLICSLVAIWFYWELSKTMGGIYTVLLLAVVMVIFVYTLMHFYMYELAVTFTDGVLKTYKNSLLMVFATLPMCILIGLIIVFVSTMFLRYLTSIGVMIVAFLCWISLMRFIADFYTARFIKKNILPRFEEQTDSN